ncbi:glutathione S-transferase DHAR2-like protein [Carex littledalei]|uniref:glutathione transferase n=1 Tax=Carex littledalei TaxID=544730 RepID=A0A833RG27_9POAL|nr:glutathione S-transferase DHAR2-like protein [Carex littledalei]
MVVEVFVKAAHGAPDKLGDCPFCHKILLMLEEKNVPYQMKLVSGDKPRGEKCRCIRMKWVPDSDVIAQIIEEKYPEPSLVTSPEYSTVSYIDDCM